MAVQPTVTLSQAEDRTREPNRESSRTYSPRGGLAQGLRGFGQHHLELEIGGESN